MKYFHKLLQFVFLLLFYFPAFALEEPANVGGGLDIKQLQKCEKKYAKICSIPRAKSLGEELAKKWPCMLKNMKIDKSCRQAYLIREITGYPPTQLRRYPRGIVVFNITTLADGQEIFYIIDNSGHLIGLTENLDKQFKKVNQSYYKLTQSYPDLSFTTFVFWSAPFEDQFPKTSFNGSNLQLTFLQELRDGPCVACKPVAIAYVAYVFDAKGKYSGSRVWKIKILSTPST